MRVNLPITDHEFVLHDDQYLISKTDLKGRITYCNPAFVEISGFTREELLGKAHNIVRHPDMPPAVFEDMWDTLNAGRPWLAVVKNRHKSGGFYWVLANAMPVIEAGEVTGYASVRIKASRQQIEDAEHFYAQVAAGQLGGYALQAGQRTAVGWRKWLRAAAYPLRSGIVPATLRGTALLCALAAIPTHLLLSTREDVSRPAWWAVYGGCALAAMLASAMRAGRFVKQLKTAEEVARQIAAGNLVNEIDTDIKGEARNLYFYLDIMRKSLTGISTEVASQTTRHAGTLAKLHADSSDLASHTSDQRDSLQDTAASVAQLAATVARNTESAASASALAKESQTAATQGGETVGQMVSTMQAINEGSRKIAEIVSVIEGIAFQTNILALNAAVEAARAGDQGKGFAVVAGEVHSLAQRTTQAAKEIKTLIDTSVTQMSVGSSQASTAGTAMQEIIQSVDRVSQFMAEIVHASGEQAAGVDTISTAVAKMENLVHKNASLVEELAGVAQHLGAESSSMVDTIGVFHTQASKERAVMPAQKAPPLRLAAAHSA
ncbi:MAG: methyl-accepting chemotaxis protein [Achromobacter sp.]|uniref:methyl-accepting chemotaxis protein n=1 Tax=Achromobacter sp. TaxID=134375 RepID=UPI002583FA78|nr:PAS domain-containing methyl-accepting chemotaxis protein [Achromobacter sp.]MCW0207994.1 methyl-accepting chemotaxis protein [Achromobacter sp.]